MTQSKNTEIPDITCKPIDTLDEVLRYMENPPNWAAKCLKYKPNNNLKVRNCDYHQSSRSEEPRYYCHFDVDRRVVCERYDGSVLPKTLVCHDMANGYHDDSYVDGTSNWEAYHYQHWAAVDIFCYFSHHFITIPPLAWINAAHKHNVKVIGTVITEWSDGICKWDSILSSPDSYRRFADSLVAITRHLCFEGWLLNVENKIAKPRLLVEFVQYLRERLHEQVPGAELIWYDSVTIKGDLSWQNALNKNNADFFRACDGIFTNYSWSEDHVRQSAAFASAERRSLDVYIGVDVWGRNFYGGGHFNTAEAVQIVFKHGCSLAIFAQAWTHEGVDENEEYPTINGDDSRVAMSKYEQFLLRDRALWDSLWPYLNTRVADGLPFQTSFCRGNGRKQWRYGQVINEGTWHNMSEMEYQPTSNYGPHGYRLYNADRPSNLKYSEMKGSEIAAMISDTVVQASSNVIVKVKRAFQRMPQMAKRPRLDDSRADKDVTDPSEYKKLENPGNSSSQDPPMAFILANSTGTTSIVPSKKPPGSVIQYKIALVPNEEPCYTHYSEDSFNGGSCLIVKPMSSESMAALLFHCEFPCATKMIVNVVTKSLENEQSLNVICTMVDDAKRVFHVCLSDDENSFCMPNGAEVHLLLPVDATQLHTVQKHLLIDKPGTYVPIDNDNGWSVKYFVLERPASTVTSLSCRAVKPEGRVLLGHLALCPMD